MGSITVKYLPAYKFNLVALYVQQLLIYSFVLSCYIVQRKAMLLEIDTLKTSHDQNKTSTYITITSILLYYVFNLRDTTE